MNSMANNALTAYAQAEVDAKVVGGDPHQLISMLFDAALVALSKAKKHMQLKNVAEKGAAISHAISIIDSGLKLSLDEKAGGELAQNLKSLYEYMCHQLLTANLKNEVAPLDEVAHLLMDLKGAWDTIRKPSPQQAAPQQAAPQQAAPQQVAPRQAAPQQAAPQQVAPRQVAPRQVAPQQAAPQQAAPLQAAPQQAAPRPVAPQQVAPRLASQLAAYQAAPQPTAPQPAYQPAAEPPPQRRSAISYGKA